MCVCVQEGLTLIRMFYFLREGFDDDCFEWYYSICREMRGRSYSYSPSPPRGYGRSYRSPSPRGRYRRGKEPQGATSLLVRNLRHDCRFAFVLLPLSPIAWLLATGIIVYVLSNFFLLICNHLSIFVLDDLIIYCDYSCRILPYPFSCVV